MFLTFYSARLLKYQTIPTHTRRVGTPYTWQTIWRRAAETPSYSAHKENQYKLMFWYQLPSLSHKLNPKIQTDAGDVTLVKWSLVEAYEVLNIHVPMNPLFYMLNVPCCKIGR